MTTRRSPAPREIVNDDEEARALLAQIAENKNLTLTAWATRRLACVLAVTLDQRTEHGRTTAILAETGLRSRQQADLLDLCEVHDERFNPRLYDRKTFLRSLESLSEKDQNWFDHLDLVLIPCVEDTLMRPFEWEHLCYCILDRCSSRHRSKPQFVLIISPRDRAEPALRRNFPVFDVNASYTQGQHSSHERAFGGNPVREIWWTIWAAEDTYLQHLMPATTSIDYGVEPVLAYFAGGHQVKPSNYRVDGSVPMEDQLEVLQHRLTQLNKRPWPNLMEGCKDGFFVRANECSAEALRDASTNPWRVLRAMAEDDGEALLVNLVLPPTVLRGYLISNASYFGNSPLEPLTPRMLNSINATVTQIYVRLRRYCVTIKLDEIKLAIARSGAIAENDSFAQLKELFANSFGDAVANRLRIESKNEWVPSTDCSTGRFVRQSWVKLEDVQPSEDVRWLRELKIEAEGIPAVDIVRQDHVVQLYPPGQQCCLAGKLFRVEAIEDDTVRVRKVAELEVLTRKTHKVSVKNSLIRRNLEFQTPISGSGFEFRCDALELSFFVSSDEWWESVDFGNTWRRQECKQLQREYQTGRALRLVLNNADGEAMWSVRQRLALVVWLNEAARTFLPESHSFFIAATCTAQEDCPQSEPARSVLPQLEFVGESDPMDLKAVWIFEDSHADLGIVGACKDRAEWLLNLCLDYLVWRDDEAALPLERAPCALNQLRLQRDVLAYGQESTDPAFDFVGLRTVLASCGLISERTSITGNRKREAAQQRQPDETFSTRSSSVQGVSEDLTGPYCDFCGQKITTQGELVNGELHRCGACSAVAVDLLSEAERICNKVLADFPRVFGHRLDQTVKVRFASANQIAAAQGEQFLPTSSFDSRAIGLATIRDSENLIVTIEQGHPAQQLAMTLAHEFTHIWQYAWADYERMEREHGKVLIEGHASWAEMVYAQAMISEATTHDQRRLWEQELSRFEEGILQREDANGQGYRQLMQIVGSHGDGFGWVAGLYPRSG